MMETPTTDKDRKSPGDWTEEMVIGSLLIVAISITVSWFFTPDKHGAEIVSGIMGGLTGYLTRKKMSTDKT